MGKRKQSHPSRSTHHRGDSSFVQHRTVLEFYNPLKRHKSRHAASKMADATMTTGNGGDSERQDGNQQRAYMIPGIDGRLQFAFPKKIITILRYIDQYALTSTLGGASTVVFRMNSVFDPDFTNVGHQPLYYDRYSAIYNNYRVLGSRLEATISPTALSTGVGPWVFGINGSESSVSMSTSSINRAEQNDAVSTVFNQQDPPTVLSYAFSPEIKLDRPRDDDSMGATVNTNPTNQYYAHVWFSDLNGATSTAIMRVVIEYTVEFFGVSPYETQS